MDDVFETWLRETQSQLDKVNDNIAEVSRQVGQNHDSWRTCRESAAELTASSRTLGGVGGRLSSIHNDLRESSRRVALLSHSIEVSFALAYLFRRMGTDLSQLIPPQTIEYIPGNRILIEQAGPAHVVLANATPCHALGLDQLGVDVPMRIEWLGDEKKFDLNVVMQGFLSGTQPTVSLQQTRLPDMCPPGAVNTLIRASLLTRAFTEIARQLQASLVPPGGFDMGLGQPVYTAACIFDSFRLFGVLHRRPRGVLPPLAGIPSWADAALKLSSYVLVDKVRAMMQEYGASMIDGPHFIPGNRFELTGEKEVRESTSIGCIEFSITIRVRVRLSCSMAIQSGNEIVFRALQVGSPDVKADTSPFVVPGVQDLIDVIIADLIAAQIPNIQLSETFHLSMASRLELDLDSTRFAAFMTLRM